MDEPAPVPMPAGSTCCHVEPESSSCGEDENFSSSFIQCIIMGSSLSSAETLSLFSVRHL